ncbi:hypothetical protein VNO80_09359 [Phaseolus coccineus]|uniref:Uncharacterized protein n=1 Tax=Phaseolus coccineus TaxID=3886 RepID=A0AAN9NBB0_PHACN
MPSLLCCSVYVSVSLNNVQLREEKKGVDSGEYSEEGIEGDSIGVVVNEYYRSVRDRFCFLSLATATYCYVENSIDRSDKLTSCTTASLIGGTKLISPRTSGQQCYTMPLIIDN